MYVCIIFRAKNCTCLQLVYNGHLKFQNASLLSYFPYSVPAYKVKLKNNIQSAVWISIIETTVAYVT